ncbi:MAG: Peptidyl-tRNA hydrolase [Chlamydiae bacterium]|nr:Peptidyl-tRNA hydrolase [Chlamydiota bacterium]
MGDSKHKVFVGLGNFGKRYQKTRHNIGFMVTERLCDRHFWELKDVPRFKAKVAKGVMDDKTIHILEPATYMNASGQALKRYLDYFHLSSQDVCVVTDDIALSFGEMRLRAMGSSGGHNGLKSIEQHLGTRQYPRLRLGIAGEHHQQRALEDYVLDEFSRAEREQLPLLIESAVDVLERLVTQDIERVMKDVNTRQEKENESNKNKSL